MRLLFVLLLITSSLKIYSQKLELALYTNYNKPFLLEHNLDNPSRLFRDTKIGLQAEALICSKLFKSTYLNFGAIYMFNRANFRGVIISSGTGQSWFGIPITLSTGIYKKLSLELGGQFNGLIVKPSNAPQEWFEYGIRGNLSYAINELFTVKGLIYNGLSKYGKSSPKTKYGIRSFGLGVSAKI